MRILIYFIGSYFIFRTPDTLSFCFCLSILKEPRVGLGNEFILWQLGVWQLLQYTPDRGTNIVHIAREQEPRHTREVLQTLRQDAPQGVRSVK